MLDSRSLLDAAGVHEFSGGDDNDIAFAAQLSLEVIFTLRPCDLINVFQREWESRWEPLVIEELLCECNCEHPHTDTHHAFTVKQGRTKWWSWAWSTWLYKHALVTHAREKVFSLRCIVTSPQVILIYSWRVCAVLEKVKVNSFCESITRVTLTSIQREVNERHSHKWVNWMSDLQNLWNPSSDDITLETRDERERERE